MDFDFFLQEAQKTGITIEKIDGVIAWTGEYGGKIKPNGPLAGKKIGILVGCDFTCGGAQGGSNPLNLLRGYTDPLPWY